MAQAYSGPLPEGTKPCKICREPINAQARKCIHCQSNQGWSSGLTVSATMMSLLVALVSVLATAVPAFKSLVTPVNSDLEFAFQGINADTVSLLAYNRGNRPGSLRAGAMELQRDPNDITTSLTLHIRDLPKNQPRIIEAGKTEMIQLYSDNGLELPITPAICRLNIKNSDFTGAARDDIVKFRCEDAMPFISSHVK